jgi:CBS domain containing-hemolysin-like protein
MGEQEGAPIRRYLAEPTQVLSKLLAFRVVALVLASVLTTRALLPGEASAWLPALLVVGLSLLYSLLAEVFVTLGRARGRALAITALTVARPFELFIAPMAALLVPLGRAIHSRALLRNQSDPTPLTEREVEYLVEEAENTGALDARRGQMMQNVLELKDLTARDVMVPRTRIHAVEASTPVERALAVVTEEGHSRVPVYKGQIDNILGVLHVKDLFRFATSAAAAGPGARPTLESVVRMPAFFVADSTSALTVLRDMQQRRMHMAIVVDEFGAVAGLVTLEDVLEQLVGDIQDEHDAEEALVVEQERGRYLVAAAIPLGKLGEQLGIELPEAEAYASLGGFLAERAGRVPTVGTVVHWNGVVFTVREGDARKVTKVEIVVPGRASAPPRAPAGAASDSRYRSAASSVMSRVP